MEVAILNQKFESWTAAHDQRASENHVQHQKQFDELKALTIEIKNKVSDFPCREHSQRIVSINDRLSDRLTSIDDEVKWFKKLFIGTAIIAFITGFVGVLLRRAF